MADPRSAVVVGALSKTATAPLEKLRMQLMMAGTVGICALGGVTALGSSGFESCAAARCADELTLLVLICSRDHSRSFLRHIAMAALQHSLGATQQVRLSTGLLNCRIGSIEQSFLNVPSF